MLRSLRAATSIGLVIGVSLATGYLTGRLHASFMPDAADKVTHRSTPYVEAPLSKISQSARPNVPTRLNPAPSNLPETRTFRPGSASYPTSNAARPENPKEKYQPRHIGSFIDPDSPIANTSSVPQHIGSFQDPDDPWENN